MAVAKSSLKHHPLRAESTSQKPTVPNRNGRSQTRDTAPSGNLKGKSKEKVDDTDDLKNDVRALVQSLNLPTAGAEASVASVPHSRKEKNKNVQRKKLEQKPTSKPPGLHSNNKKPVAQSELESQQARTSKTFQTEHLTKPSSISTLPKSRKSAKFLIPPTPDWYNAVNSLPPKESLPSPSPEFAKSTTSKAMKLLEDEAETALANPGEASSAVGSSDTAFLSQILSSGTLSDRLSALTLMTQASPLHNQKALESLRTMASKKAREESLKALRAIVDWWVGGGSPDRKLRYLNDQPLTHPGVTDQHLLIWSFEDWLKKYFFSILQLLEPLSLDLLPYVRTQTLALIFTLLRSKPEQEHNLLRLLVNKLGDTEKTVASKASYFILQLLQIHPSMKAIVIREVSSLILRSTASNQGAKQPISTANLHARYYGVLAFNQITLSPNDREVAELLVTIYFEMFKSILGGPSRDTEPIADTVVPDKDAHGHRRQGRKQTKAQPKAEALGAAGFAEVEDADSKIISAILTGVNRALPFAKMEAETFDGYMESLFRITHSATFNVSIQALVLICQVAASRKLVADRFYRTLYDSLVDPRLCNSSKQAMYLNLLFKATKQDTNLPRTCAFVKRLLQVLGLHQPGFICGALYLLGELFKAKPELQNMVNRTEPGPREEPNAEQKGPTKNPEVYDARKRDPQFANADKTGLWELTPLLDHFHPSVSLHAHQLLNAEPITTSADLTLHTVSQFLDRFIYKNPKTPKPRGASTMQPSATSAQDSDIIVSSLRHGVEGTVNNELFWNQDAKDVPVDQLFFHKFFSNRLEERSARDRKRNKKPDGTGDKSDEDGHSAAVASDEVDSDDDPEEAEIWKAMKNSLPAGEGDLDISDDDSIPSGLDDEDSDSGSESSEQGSEKDEEEDEEASSNQGSEDSGGSALDFGEDEDDLIDLGEILSGESEVGETEEGDWEGVGAAGSKRKTAEVDLKKSRKRRKVALPLFASYDDYAKMIDDAPEENI